MSDTVLDNVNVLRQEPLVGPGELKRRLPLTAAAQRTVAAGRDGIRGILARQDPRRLLVIGPCSIHDPQAALEYAGRLAGLAAEVEDRLLIVMRAYFEKPRTTVGWKGFVNDPRLDGSFRIEEGLQQARLLLLQIAELGLPTGTEALDPIVPHYLADLLSWSAIGARTTESQTHREMASGLSMPVGFKNGTDGSLGVAINALLSVSQPHSFLGINQEGRTAIVHTRGNPDAHVVLRGGREPNYTAADIAACEAALTQAGLAADIMVDCSHANCGKDAARQPEVAEAVVAQMVAGDSRLIGLMVESHLEFGRQPLRDPLRYGVSITDPCIDWQTTEALVRRMHAQLAATVPPVEVAG